MVKADNVHSITPYSETIACPVLPIALRVGQLWVATTEAQERDAAENETVGDQIDDLQIARSEMASFVRARSLGGALFQVALASEAAERLYGQLPAEAQLYNRVYLKLKRLLILIAAELRDESGPDDFALIRDIISAYIDLDQERAILDAVPYPQN
jgi:hypothetical protein